MLRGGGGGGGGGGEHMFFFTFFNKFKRKNYFANYFALAQPDFFA